MTNAIFTTRLSPAYNDIPERQYHFPRTYLKQAQEAVGDWIIYYEPRRTGNTQKASGGRQSYFALARLREIVPDQEIDDHFYGSVDGYQVRHSGPFQGRRELHGKRGRAGRRCDQ